MNEERNTQRKEEEVSISRRRKLPHWQYSDSIYFITWRLHKNQSGLEPEERDLVANALKYFDDKRYTLFSFVVMDDHIHVLVRLLPEQTLPKVLHSWKSYTANRLQRNFKRKGSIWQEEYFDRIIRNGRHFYSYLKYILNNPWKRWGVEEYKWAWYKEDIGGH